MFWVFCFPESSSVNVAGKGHTQMKLLQAGDQVESYDTKTKTTCWSTVLSFLHREPERVAPYVQVQYFHPTWGYGVITASHDHMLYSVEQDSMIAAASFTPGEHLAVSKDGHLLTVEVTQLIETTAKGVYAPLTAAGTVLVDGVVASCYTAVGHSQKSIQKAFKPLRMVGEAKPSLVAHQGGDIHWYAKFLHGISKVID
jgi:hypothetical protein